MAFSFEFSAQHPQNKCAADAYAALQIKSQPLKSLVQVYFACRNMTLAYYNDRFVLHSGDIVFVEGNA